MKLRKLANPLFRAAGPLGISLGLLAGTAMAQMPETEPARQPLSENFVLSDQCALDPDLLIDEQNKRWIAVKAHTKDDLPLHFTLHLDATLPAVIEDYDQVLCKSVINNLYNLAALSYREQVLAKRYAELPENAPGFKAIVIKSLNQKLRNMGQDRLNVRINDIKIKDVQAPGLNKRQAQAMFNEGISYNYNGLPDPGNITVTSWDSQQNYYKLTLSFQPAKTAYYALGPDDEGIRRRVLDAAAHALAREVGRREKTCLEDDLPYIKAGVMAHMLNDEVLNHYIHLFDITIERKDKKAGLKQSVEISSRAAAPDEPVCITGLQKKYGLGPIPKLENHKP